MNSLSRYVAVLILVLSITITGCSEEKSAPVTFDTADSAGDAVRVDAGSETFYMIYAKSTESPVVFPIGTSSGTATMNRRFFVSETMVTNALYAAVLQ